MKKIILFTLCLFVSIGLWAQSGTCGKNLTWTIVDDVLIISGTGAMDDYDLTLNYGSYSPNTPWASYTFSHAIINEGVTSIGDGALGGCSGLTSVTIPNSVTSIGNAAFSGCSGLTSVTIPNSVTHLYDAFYGCSSLTSVTIGNSVKSIESHTFEGCSALTSVTIGNSVKSIEEEAFSGCSALASICIGSSVEIIKYHAFVGATNISTIYSLAIMPPTCESAAFDSDIYRSANVYVPNTGTALMRYVADDVWKKFFNIQEMDMTGVETPAISPLPAGRNYYNLQGVRSCKATRGINMVNGSKVLVR